MKSLYEFIVKNKIEKPKYTEEELKQDYEDIRWCNTKTEKQVFMDKYGCREYKIDKIRHCLLEICKEIRDNKKPDEYTKDDILWFGRLSDYPEAYNKLVNFLKEENNNFVLYMLDYWENYLKNKKAGGPGNFTLWEKIGYVKQKNWNYHISISDKYQIMKYLNIKRYIDENHIN